MISLKPWYRSTDRGNRRVRRKALQMESLETRELLSLTYRTVSTAVSDAPDILTTASAVDSKGNTYVTGQFSGTAHFGTFTLTAAPNTMDMFIAMIKPDGRYAWVTDSPGAAQTSPGQIVLHRGSGIVVSGSVLYVTGWFSREMSYPEFYPEQSGPAHLLSGAAQDPFIAEVDVSTGLFWWAQDIQGASGDFDWATAVAADSAGNAYVTGFYAHSLVFGGGQPGETTLSGGGGYVAEYKPDGTFVRAIPMTGRIQPDSIAIDDQQNIIVSGVVQGSATIGQDSRGIVAQGNSDGFVAKMDNVGTSDWVADFGGPTAFADANGVAVDAAGDVYATGQFNLKVDFDPGAGSSILDAGVQNDAYVTKLDPSGRFVWARRLGSTSSTDDVLGDGIAVDSGGNVILSGTFSGVVRFYPDLATPTVPVITLTSAGHDDLYVAKLDSMGQPLSAVTGGGSDFDQGYQVAVNDRAPAAETISVVGGYVGPATFGTIGLPATPNQTTIFVARLNDPPAVADYNGDGKSDIGVFGNGLFVAFPAGSQPIVHTNVGDGSYRAVAADYDGDGKTDLAVYGNGVFVVIPSSGAKPIVLQNFGGPGYIPVAADYDGDGKADPAVFKDGQFYVKLSYSGQIISPNFGAAARGAQPISGDFDGDGRSDFGYYNPTGGVFYVVRSGYGQPINLHNFGGPGFEALSGDYDGDGKTDIGVYGNGLFVVIPSAGDNPIVLQNFGNASFQALSGDYDGDGRTDIGIYGNGLFIDFPSSGGNPIVLHNFGNASFQALGGVTYADGRGTSAASVATTAASTVSPKPSPSGVVVAFPLTANANSKHFISTSQNLAVSRPNVPGGPLSVALDARRNPSLA